MRDVIPLSLIVNINEEIININDFIYFLTLLNYTFCNCGVLGFWGFGVLVWGGWGGVAPATLPPALVPSWRPAGPQLAEAHLEFVPAAQPPVALLVACLHPSDGVAPRTASLSARPQAVKLD